MSENRWVGSEVRRVPYEDWGTIVFNDYGDGSTFLTIQTIIIDAYDMCSYRLYIEHHIPTSPHGAWETDVHFESGKHLLLNSIDYLRTEPDTSAPQESP